MTRELDSIKADEEIVMTPVLERAFITAGCKPACHCCWKPLQVGDKFKLAYIKAVHWKSAPTRVQFTEGDEMLCMECTPLKLLRKRREITVSKEKRNHGYSRPHTGEGE